MCKVPVPSEMVLWVAGEPAQRNHSADPKGFLVKSSLLLCLAGFLLRCTSWFVSGPYKNTCYGTWGGHEPWDPHSLTHQTTRLDRNTCNPDVHGSHTWWLRLLEHTLLLHCLLSLNPNVCLCVEFIMTKVRWKIQTTTTKLGAGLDLDLHDILA